jgi:hypothetical protein
MAQMSRLRFYELKDKVERRGYGNMEDVVKFFWACSIDRKMDEFNFDEAFELVTGTIAIKLEQHGLLGKEGCIDALSHAEDRWDFTGVAKHMSGKGIRFTASEMEELVYGYVCGRYAETFGGNGNFPTLTELYNKLLLSHRLSQKEAAMLFDECIHAQHETGFIFELDMEALHNEVDAMYGD